MKVILRYVDMYCGECGEYMHVGAKTVKCMNKHCREYKVRYALPAIKVERVDSCGKQEAIGLDLRGWMP